MKILLVDIETSPIISYTWGLFNQNVGLNQIETDWHVLSWSAKWLDEKKILYMDQRNAKNIEDDKIILQGIWNLLDEADVVITHNGDKFDIKKLNARFILNGMKPPSSFKSIDTLKLARKNFGFTSNKLEFLSKKLNIKHVKHDHKKFPGFELWKECLAGNIEAWKEMEKYNKIDVLALEEIYKKLIPWGNPINFDLYHEREENVCTCGSRHFYRNGYSYQSTGKYQRYRCFKCGSEFKDSGRGKNLLSKEKMKTLKTPVRR